MEVLFVNGRMRAEDDAIASIWDTIKITTLIHQRLIAISTARITIQLDLGVYRLTTIGSWSLCAVTLLQRTILT